LQQQQAPELHEHVHAIQSSLFCSENQSGTARTFDSAALSKLVTSLRKSRQQKRKQELQEQQYALPPLYKS
jgi:ABC-type transporter Mla MlaB component